ncbi:MAG: DUF192 domain-containing protein [Blastocatellia bacterium]|nr:DUF192 domain-containing protein [Blastocatellia bacterium]
MAIAFTRSMRSLETDHHRRSVWGMLLLILFLGGWGLWGYLAKIRLYEVSELARIEVNEATFPIEALIEGRIVYTNLEVGKTVQPGDVLVELDAEVDRLRLETERKRFEALARQIDALRREISAQVKAQTSEQQVDPVTLAEARARHREAAEDAAYSQQEVTKLTVLHEGGYISELQLLRAQAELQKRKAGAEALDLEVHRLELSQQTRDNEKAVRLEQLNREVTRLQGEMTTASAGMETLLQDTEKYRVRASVAGKIGEVMPLQVGTIVHRGEKLGALVPAGDLKIIAFFPPAVALGRLKPGQTARMSMANFPWTQYGEVWAEISQISTEARDGMIRVECRVLPTSTFRIPLQHGMPGSLEIEVEQVTPLTLLLRSAGRNLAPLSTSPNSGMKTTRLTTPNGNVLVVEIARTPAEVQRGLMFRQSLLPDTGMLFVFPNEGPLPFWMKNTLIDLDIVFLDTERRVTGVAANIRRTVPGTPDNQIARANGQGRFALEIPAGKAREYGIEPGKTLGFEF